MLLKSNSRTAPRSEAARAVAGTRRPVGPQPIDVPALFPVDVHRAGRGEAGRHHDSTPIWSRAWRLGRGVREDVFTHATQREGVEPRAAITAVHHGCATLQFRLDTCSLSLHTRRRPRRSDRWVRGSHAHETPIAGVSHEADRPGCSASSLIVWQPAAEHGDDRAVGRSPERAASAAAPAVAASQAAPPPAPTPRRSRSPTCRSPSPTATTPRCSAPPRPPRPPGTPS